MSKNEKRYFKVKVNAGNSGKEAEKARIYLKLYDTINQMDVFDPKLLKKKFPTNLPAYQRQLFDSILRSMRDYQSKNSKQIQIKELIMDARYLYERSLYDLSSKRLEEAKKLAKQIDDQLALLDINKQERNLLRASATGKKGANKEIKEAILEKEYIIKNINQEYTFNDAYDSLFSVVVRKRTLKEEEKEELKAIYDPILFEVAAAPESLFAKRRFLQSRALYYMMLEDFEQVNHYFSEVVDWWKNNPEIQKEAYYWYIIDLSNLLQNCMSVEDFELFEQIYTDLKNELEKSVGDKGFNEHTRGVAFQKLYINQLGYLFFTDHLEKIYPLAPEIEHALNTYKINLGSKLILLHNVMVIFFILEDFEQLSYWAQKIIDLIPAAYREDIQKIALVFNLICSLEDGVFLNDALSLKLADNHLKKTFNLKKNSFELKTVNTIKELDRLGDYDRKDKYIEFLEYLKEVSTSGRLAGLDVLTYWVESKIKKSSVRAVMKDNQK